MYIVIATIDNEVSYGVDKGLYLCRKIFSDLETAKKAAEDYLSTMENGEWIKEEWAELNDHWWERTAQVVHDSQDATLYLYIYKVEPDECEALERTFTMIGGTEYFE
jgi:hypothetical protein